MAQNSIFTAFAFVEVPELFFVHNVENSEPLLYDTLAQNTLLNVNGRLAVT